jgi:hypothetical protein
MNSTIKRNAIRTGKNSKSYNDKHPENPVMFKVVKYALKKAVLYDHKFYPYPDIEKRTQIMAIANLSKPEINRSLLGGMS